MIGHADLNDAVTKAREGYEALLKAQVLAYRPDGQDAAQALLDRAAEELSQARRLMRQNVLDFRPKQLRGDNLRPAPALDVSALAEVFGGPSSPEPAA